jgi:hypothetical protein
MGVASALFVPLAVKISKVNPECLCAHKTVPARQWANSYNKAWIAAVIPLGSSP